MPATRILPGNNVLGAGLVMIRFAFTLGGWSAASGRVRDASRGRVPPMRVVAILLAVFMTPVLSPAEIKAGDAFPALAEVPFDGGSAPSFQGKVVLVDFWASWCAPCKASFPAYAKLQSEYAARGLLILAVSVDEKADAYAAFLKKFAPPFLTVRDKDQQLVREVKVPAMPTCYLIGRDGRVRFMHQGFHGADTENELRRELDALLAENQ